MIQPGVLGFMMIVPKPWYSQAGITANIKACTCDLMPDLTATRTPQLCVPVAPFS